MLPESRSYDEIVRQFRWQVPARFNIGVEVCDRWAEREPGKLALVAVGQDGQSRDVSYGWLRETSNRMANVLAAHGIDRGDRVAILLPQAPEVAAIHIAIYKLGAVALPLAMLFGPDAIAYRLQNAGAKAVFTNAQGLAKIAEIRRSRANPWQASSWFCRWTERVTARSASTSCWSALHQISRRLTRPPTIRR